MLNIGPGEFALIALVALLVFGPDRIPALARSLARGYRELTRLKRQLSVSVDEIKQDLDLDLELEAGLDGLPDPRRLLREPAAPRVDSGGRPQAALPVPAEDDYLAAEAAGAAARGAGGGHA